MKRFTMFLSMFAMAAAIVSCENADIDDIGASSDSSLEGNAYLTLTVAATTTRADAVADGDDTPADATLGENTISTVRILAFDTTMNLLAAYNSEESKGNSDWVTDDNDDKTWNFEVPESSRYFLVVANENAAITNLISSITTTANHSWSTVYSMLQTGLELSTTSSINPVDYTNGVQYDGDISTSFTMVNEGTYVSSSTNTVLVTANDFPLSTKSSNPSTMSVIVDRLASKFTCDASSLTVDDNEYASYVGVRLNATNRKGSVYSPITVMTQNLYDYRVDPNMEVGTDVADLLANFNWLDNDAGKSNSESADIVAKYFTEFNTSSTGPEYVVENTAAPNTMDYNNLTQAVVCIAYVPDYTTVISGVTNNNGEAEYTYLTAKAAAGTTWYTMHTSVALGGTKYFTFDGIQEFYKYLIAIDDTDNEDDMDCQDLADLMDYQLAYILSEAGETTATWETVSQTTLEGIANLGYIAATAGNYSGSNTDLTDENAYAVMFYKDGLNYYDVFIQHDSTIDPNTTGRWGMVRNNLYSLTVSSVSAPGLPYIPDPTDPAITDPANPDPTNPEPADTENGYLSVTITMNPWTTWVQDTTLGNTDSAN